MKRITFPGRQARGKKKWGKEGLGKSKEKKLNKEINKV
jgi:hypothetical protein